MNLCRPFLFFLAVLSFFCRFGHALTLEEKVGQLLVVHFNGSSVNEEAKRLFLDVKAGGVIYYNWANRLESPEQIHALSRDLQKLAAETSSKIPLFICVDQEGGIVARLSNGFTPFSGNRSLGVCRDPLLVEKCAYAIGREARAVGVNFVFAPVVDVNSNPKNPVIGIRSFSNDPEEVILMGRSALNGFKKAGILTCLKHYPGHGDVESDSHYSLPIVNKSRAQLERSELRPFRELAQEADSVMTAHILLPFLDAKQCATLSKPILDLLRAEMKFEGLIVSDSLVMKGVLENVSSQEEAVLRAFEAGCDLLVLGGKDLLGTFGKTELTVEDVVTIHRYLVQAVHSGRLSEQRIDASVERILKAKQKLADQVSDSYVPLDRTEHLLLSQEIAKKALQIHAYTSARTSKDSVCVAVFPDIVRGSVEQAGLSTLLPSVSARYLSSLDPSVQEIEKIVSDAADAESLLLFSYNGWKFPGQQELWRRLAEFKKPLAIVFLRDPLDEEFFKGADLTITTYSPTVPSIEAALFQLRTSFFQ